MNLNFTSILIGAATSLVFLSCQEQHPKKLSYQPDYTIDHLIFLASDSTLEKRFDQVLTKAKKLETVHQKQGTRGVYYLFLNSFIEILYLEDSLAAVANQENFRSQYVSRWSGHPEQRVGVGLKMIPFDTATVSFQNELYHTSDSDKNDFYVMSTWNRTKAPFVFITPPESEHKTYKDTSEVRQKAPPEIVEDFLACLSHPIAIKELTSVQIYHPESNTKESNYRVLSMVEAVETFAQDQFKIILTFDEHVQNLESDINEFIRLRY